MKVTCVWPARNIQLLVATQRKLIDANKFPRYRAFNRQLNERPSSPGQAWPKKKTNTIIKSQSKAILNKTKDNNNKTLPSKMQKSFHKFKWKLNNMSGRHANNNVLSFSFVRSSLVWPHLSVRRTANFSRSIIANQVLPIQFIKCNAISLFFLFFIRRALKVHF